MGLIEETVAKIEPVSQAWIDKAYERLDNLTKPTRSLGYLEELAARYVAIRQEERPAIGGKRIAVFAGDHGVAAEGVSAYPQDVTKLMVLNFVNGGAAINVLARRAGAEVDVIDIGVAADLSDLDGLQKLNVKRGTDNMAQGPAMSVEDARRAIEVGIERALAAADAGVTLVGTGDMGIANTTPSAALYAVFLGCPVADVVGPGTGLDAAGVQRKTSVIEQALQVNHERFTDPLSILAAVGGLEIAGIAGFCLGAAARRMAVVVDGYISSAGALTAMRLCPAVKDTMVFSHRSAEPGHQRLFESEGLRPVLDLGLRLGEGTGAAIVMQIIEDSLAIYNEMVTFQEAGITPGA